MDGTLSTDEAVSRLRLDNAHEAESNFLRGIDEAIRMNAKGWELRATNSLTNFWARQVKTQEARKRLAPVYGRFTEDFDTADLKEAKSLLDELDRLFGGNRECLEWVNVETFAGLIFSSAFGGRAVAQDACAEALAEGACSADMVLNILNRRRQPPRPAPIPTPASLRLRHQPTADCTGYDRLWGADHGAP